MIYQHIEGLIQKAMEVQLIQDGDQVYVKNRMMNLLHLEDFPDTVPAIAKDSIPNILDAIIQFAVENQLIEDVFDDKEILAAQIMDALVARPSTVNQLFNQKYKESPSTATNYFYNLSKNSNYIQMNRIKNNIRFKTETSYGEIDITINLSKPEKDPGQIKREKEMKHEINYPKCVLCVENEGYTGRTGYPARANHRMITIPLLNENWFLQYSPYVYYDEHSILLCEQHRDMKMNKKVFERLLLFIEKFPHYFIGSNADLPIVGGSILSHDHYQAGRYEFAMTKAKDAFTFKLDSFPGITASILEWPLSVIRLQCDNQGELLDAADHILTTWKAYSDCNANIEAFTDKEPHNTITPIARRRNDRYELDLVLRNNRTSHEHPMGIFHPHADVQHIKKENIGLIEVMGLAVLPARLKGELAEVKKALLGQESQIEPYHQSWTDQLKAKYGVVSDAAKAEQAIEKELGNRFIRILEDAGVFKCKDAFERFINTLNG